MRKPGLLLCFVFCLCGCTAPEANNDADAGDVGSTNNNPPECPVHPPGQPEACAPEGLACTYALDCPCGASEDFVWTCTGGMLMQPSLACSSGPAASCPNIMTQNDLGMLPGDMSTQGMDMTATVDMAPDIAPDLPPPRLEAHGCTYDVAMDMTGQAAVVLTDLLAWDLDHMSFCLKVTAGTVVTWNGNFTTHPLDGGISPTADAANPIEIAGNGIVGVATIDVTLAVAGDYPYFCGIHTGIMRGVVYVDP